MYTFQPSLPVPRSQRSDGFVQQALHQLFLRARDADLYGHPTERVAAVAAGHLLLQLFAVHAPQARCIGLRGVEQLGLLGGLVWVAELGADRECSVTSSNATRSSSRVLQQLGGVLLTDKSITT